MKYPDGAIKSIEEFQALFIDGQGYAWEASKMHSKGIPNKINVTGTIIKKLYSNKNEYIGYETINDNCKRGHMSCKDMHLIDQDYNDWFLFSDEAKANAYLGISLV